MSKYQKPSAPLWKIMTSLSIILFGTAIILNPQGRIEFQSLGIYVTALGAMVLTAALMFVFGFTLGVIALVSSRLAQARLVKDGTHDDEDGTQVSPPDDRPTRSRKNAAPPMQRSAANDDSIPTDAHMSFQTEVPASGPEGRPA